MFYDEMAAMVQDLLQPDSAGGLGQGAIQIIRTTPGGIDPLHPETPVAPVRLVVTVDQIGMSKAEYRTGETVITTDLAYMITPHVGFYPEPGDLVRVVGVHVGTVVHVERLGSLDVALYWTVWANR